MQVLHFDRERISTHTPAWGVTLYYWIVQQKWKISTHTPAWGVTQEIFDFLNVSQHFNSHARVGRDAYYTAMLTNRGISTHTPAWGVTKSTSWCNVRK